MKRLALQTIAAMLVALVASIGMGIAISSAGGSAAGFRDVAIIILALFSLVGSVVAAAVYFAGAWAVGRYGSKGVAAVAWVGRKVLTVESTANAAVERAAVRPVARTARAFTTGKTFMRAVLGLAER